jgi:3-keto-5-aminohexanoate cleavage enzyme
VTVKAQNPAVPYTAEEFGDEAKKCYDAGAAIVHIHARDPEKGNPSHDLNIIKAVIENIKKKAPDVIINLSTAISAVATPKERIAPVQNYKPPLASLNTNSMNFSVGDFKTGKVVMGNTNIFNLGNLLNLMPEGSTWSVCGVAKDQFRAGLCAAAWGGHIRVGLEDNIRSITGELAKGSWEQVAWAKKVAEIAGREVVQGECARKVLNLLKDDVEL